MWDWEGIVGGDAWAEVGDEEVDDGSIYSSDAELDEVLGIDEVPQVAGGDSAGEGDCHEQGSVDGLGDNGGAVVSKPEMFALGESGVEVEKGNICVLADEVGGEGSQDDAGNRAQDSLKGFLVLPETGGWQDLGDVDKEDHDAADEEAHPNELGRGLASVEFGDGVGDEEGDGVGEDASGDGPTIDVQEFDG